MGRLGPGLIATAAIVLWIAVPAAAAKTVYVATNGGGSKYGCTQQTPCDIVTGFGYATQGDTIILGPGTYGTNSTLSDDGADLTIEGSSAVKIVSPAIPAMNLSASTLSDVQVVGDGLPAPGGDPAVLLLSGSATAERVSAEQEDVGDNPPASACLLRNSARVLDSLCDGQGRNWGLTADALSGATTATARNVTAVGANGIHVSDYVNQTTTLNASDVIAYSVGDGTLDDIVADSNYGASGGQIVVNLTNSRYDTVLNPENPATVTVTPVGTDGNIPAAPQFVSSTDFHEQQTSPTVHAGTLTGVAAGETDLDGNPRTVSGLIDMGAYQFQPLAPTVSANAAGSIGSSTATITGTINPDGGDTTCAVKYTTSPGQPFNQSTPCTTADLGAGVSSLSVQANLTGLAPDTTYYFALVAANEAQSTASSTQSFTTLPQDPAVTQNPSDETVGVGQTATFTAAASSVPAADVTWEVSTDGGHTFSATVAHADSLPVVGTLAENGYVYDATFENPADGVTVTTAPATLTVTAPPVASTGSVSALTSAGATLSGTVNPNGSAITACTFRYGPHGGELSQSAACSPASAGAGRTPAAVSATVSDLAASTSYDYELVATNADGTTTSAPVQSFTTSAAKSSTPPPPPPPPPVRIKIARSKATVEGSRAAIGIACAGPASAHCTGTLTLSSRRTTYGGAKFSLRVGRTATVEVKLSKSLLKSLARARHHRLKLTATAVDALSHPSRVTLTVTLEKPGARA